MSISTACQSFEGSEETDIEMETTASDYSGAAKDGQSIPTYEQSKDNEGSRGPVHERMD